MNNKLALVFNVLFLCVTNLVLAQKENNNWFFGKNAGITFNNGSPVILTSSAMDAFEGSISVSDPEGNLLFYSNGETIWNSNHVPMPNGTGLLGSYSATQAVLAVPQPGSSNIYYIFTVEAYENNFKNGLRYSILDMSLDGGLGDITNTKNILLEVPVTEKLTAVRHGNNRDYWILAHKWNSNAFVSYKLTDVGLSGTAVISNVGSMHEKSPVNAVGQMKANRKGTKIALAITAVAKLELFDFNAFTGAVSNLQTTNRQLYSPYGVEFSGDGTKLYCTIDHWQPLNLLQFNLADSAGMNAVSTINSGYSSPSRLFALQIGPDNKIYCKSRTEYLAVINDPDSLVGTCNYIKNGVKLSSATNDNGLPSLVIPPLKTVEADVLAVIPNIITPNQDKLNDAFVLQNLNANDFELQLFNRWGSLVYKTESYLNDWEANGVGSGVYYYLLKNPITGQKFKGWLEVIK